MDRYLKKFLQSEYLLIQFKTVECLTIIFNKQSLNYNSNEMSCLNIREFHLKTLNALKLHELSLDADNDDRRSCLLSTRLQLYCSIVGSCYALRKQVWFSFIELCCNEIRMNADKIKQIVTKLCNDIFNEKPSKALAYLMPDLMGFWIERNHHVSRLPWNLTDCQSHTDFLTEYIPIITMHILRYRPQDLNALVQMIYANSISDILQPVSIILLHILLIARFYFIFIFTISVHSSEIIGLCNISKFLSTISVT